MSGPAAPAEPCCAPTRGPGMTVLGLPCNASWPSVGCCSSPPPHAGVTVWELGQLHRGAWAHQYWSSPGCLYHHAYPVGYRATKVAPGCLGPCVLSVPA